MLGRTGDLRDLAGSQIQSFDNKSKLRCQTSDISKKNQRPNTLGSRIEVKSPKKNEKLSKTQNWKISKPQTALAHWKRIQSSIPKAKKLAMSKVIGVLDCDNGFGAEKMKLSAQHLEVSRLVESKIKGNISDNFSPCKPYANLKSRRISLKPSTKCGNAINRLTPDNSGKIDADTWKKSKILFKNSDPNVNAYK